MPTESDSQRSGSSAQAADAEETHPTSFPFGWRPRIGRSPIILLIIGAGLIFLSMHIPGSFAAEHLVEPLLELVGVFFVAGSALMVIRRLGDIPKARSMVVAAACLGILSQTLTVCEQISYLDGVPLLGNGGFLHESVENKSFPLAVVLLLAGFFYAALEAQTARHHLAEQRLKFSEELTERKRAEGALERSEDKYRELVENVNDVIYEVTSEGLVTYVSPAVESLVGYSLSELIDQPFNGFIYGDDLARAAEGFQKVLAGIVEPSEYRLVNRSGEIRWVLTSSKPILEGGKVIGVRGVLADITKRKLAEEAVRESEEKYRHLFEQLNDAAMVAETETGIILEANEQAESLLGRTRDEIIGMHHSELHDPDRKEYYLGMFAAHVVKGHATEFDGEVVRKDGSVVPVMISAATLTLGGKRLIVGLFRDIAERKRAEQMLQDSERRALALLNAPTDRVALMDRDGVFQALNKQMAESLGASVDELIGTCAWDLIPTHLAASRRERLQEVFRSGKPVHREDTREGTVFDNSLYPVVDSEGNITAVALFARDITALKRAEEELRRSRNELEMQVEKRTAELRKANEELLAEIAERRRAEDALRESEARYRTLIETSPDAITLADTEGKILLTNRRAAFVHGFESVEEMLSDMGNVFDFMSQKDRRRAIEDGQRVLREGSLTNLEYQLLRKDGTYFPAEVSTSVITDEEGNPRTFLMVVRDVTARKRGEKALRESEERYRAVLEDQTELICRWLPEGQLTFVNDAYCRYFGKAREQLIGRSFVPLILEEDRDSVREKLDRVSRDNPIETHEQRVVAPDGEVRWQQWTNRGLFDDQGRPIEFQSVGRDITERKRAEEQIKAALEEKELLLKEIQHRVKNNLQVISSLFDLQSRYTDDDQALDMLKESRNRLRSIALIHEKLYQAQDLTKIDFAEYVRSLAVHLFRSYGVGSDAVELKTSFDTLTLSVDAAIPCALVVNELVSNCLKHAFPVGRRGQVRIELRSDEGQCTVIVADDGVGLPENLDFEDPPSLGLRLVRTLSDQLKATINLDRDGGTTFRIRFRAFQ